MPASPGRRVGFLGVGAMALHHARAVHALGHRVEVAASRSRESPRRTRFAAEFPDVRWARDGDALLADPDVDAVIASLSWDQMPEWLDRLLRADKPVLLEKPISLSATAAALAIAGAGARTETKLVGYNRRFYEPVTRLRERLKESCPISVEMTWSEPLESIILECGPLIVPNIMAFSTCHLFDLALHLLGPLKVARMWRHRRVVAGQYFDCCAGVLESANGTPVFLALNDDDPVSVGLRIRFDDHTVWHLSPFEVLTVYRGTEILEPAPGQMVRRYRPRVVETVAADARLKPGFLAQMRAFLDGPAGVAATPGESVELLRLMEAVRGEENCPEPMAEGIES